MMVSKMPDGKPEIYLACQGEGRTIGKPMVFVRLATCNLSCNFCDTFYTWNFKDVRSKNKHLKNDKVNRKDYVTEMSVDEVIKEILESKVRAVNFTGGEPTIQQKYNLEIMVKLCEKDRFWFETETNGTIKFNDEYLLMFDQINCSPKLKSSGNRKEIAYRSDVIQQLRKNPATIFKFVIKNVQDIQEVVHWEQANEVERSQIWLMPEGIDKDSIIKGTKWLIENYSSQGYNISTRLQVICFGSKRLT